MLFRSSRQIRPSEYQTIDLGNGGSLGGVLGMVDLLPGQRNIVRIPYGSRTLIAGSTLSIAVIVDTSRMNTYGDWLEIEVQELTGTVGGTPFTHSMRGPFAQWSNQTPARFRVSKPIGQQTTFAGTGVQEVLALDVDVAGEDIMIQRYYGDVFNLVMTSSRTIDTVVTVSIPSCCVLGETPLPVHLEAGMRILVTVPVTVPLSGYYTFANGSQTPLSVSLDTSGLTTSGNTITVEFLGVRGTGVSSGISYQADVALGMRNTVSR